MCRRWNRFVTPNARNDAQNRLRGLQPAGAYGIHEICIFLLRLLALSSPQLHKKIKTFEKAIDNPKRGCYNLEMSAGT